MRRWGVYPLTRAQKCDAYVAVRDRARAAGDAKAERAATVELGRLGYREPPSVPEAASLETAAASMPERAVVSKRRGRPPAPH